MIINYWNSIFDLPDLCIYETHQRLWSFFPRLPSGVRPFIWLKNGNVATMRSTIKPRCDSTHFVLEIEKFQMINFFLRCNPTYTESFEDGRKKKRSIIDSDKLLEWFNRKGDNHGFSIVSNITANNMGAVRWNGPRGKKFIVGCMDISGCIRITDEKKFTEMYLNGIGRARSFGFGMMLIFEGETNPKLEIVK